jgi:hypothetical protein
MKLHFIKGGTGGAGKIVGFFFVLVTVTAAVLSPGDRFPMELTPR